MDTKNINITSNFSIQLQGVRDSTKVVLKIGNDKVVLDLDRWTELFKNIETINTEFYRRFKYQY